MRKIYFLLLTLFSLLTLGACEPNVTYIYEINCEDQATIDYDVTEVEIAYNLYYALDASSISVKATANADWITSVDVVPGANNRGKVSITLEENSSVTSRTATITLTATSHAPKKIKVIQYGVPSNNEANHTLMFVFLGTSLDRYYKTNIEDAKAAIQTGILGNSNRIILFRQDSNTKAHISELCYDPASETCIERIIVNNIAVPSSQLMPEDLAQYISTMATEAPAKRYGVVFAGHGQAWIPRETLKGSGGISAYGASFNEWTPAPGAEVTRAYGESNVQCDIAELATAIEISGVELDYILFDACFMSNIETIYDLRNSANYIIASPCEIMGRGFPYERTLPYLFVDNGMSSDYDGAAESYYKYYRDEYTSSSRCGSVALINCNEVEELAHATKNVLESMTTGFYDRNELQTYEGQNPHQFFDFGEWVNKVTTDDEALEAFNTQLAKTVEAKYSLESFYSAYGKYGTYPINLDIYSGITTSAPTEANVYSYMCQTNWYQYVWPQKCKEVIE